MSTRKKVLLGILGALAAGAKGFAGQPSTEGEILARYFSGRRDAELYNRIQATKAKSDAERARAKYELARQQKMSEINATESRRQAEEQRKEREQEIDVARQLDIPGAGAMTLAQLRQANATEMGRRRKQAEDYQTARQAREDAAAAREERRLALAEGAATAGPAGRGPGATPETEAQLVTRAQAPYRIRLGRAQRELARLEKLAEQSLNPDDQARLEAAIQKKNDEIDVLQTAHDAAGEQAAQGPGTAYYYRAMSAERWAALTPAQQQEFVNLYGRKPAGVK